MSFVTAPGVTQAYVDAGDAAAVVTSEAYTDAQILALTERVIVDHVTEVPSVNIGGTEDDLFFDDLTSPSNLSEVGLKFIEKEVVTVVASATASRRIRKYAYNTNGSIQPANLIWDSGALTLALGGTFYLQTVILVTGAGFVSFTLRIIVTCTTTSASTVPYAVYTEDLMLDGTDSLRIKTTGTASGTGASGGDIINKFGTISKVPHGASVI